MKLNLVVAAAKELDRALDARENYSHNKQGKTDSQSDGRFTKPGGRRG